MTTAKSFIALSEEAARDSNLPKKLIQYLANNEHIELPLRPMDNIGLFYIHKIWQDKEFAIKMLENFTKKQRMLMIRDVGTNKIERYILTRFMRQYANNPERKLYVYDVAGEVMRHFNLPQQHTTMIAKLTEKIRNRAYKQAKDPFKLNQYMDIASPSKSKI
ncbi:hypothetical protein OR1_02642 [Geobacter sp. OR-1]|uniref:hypothetical protein n=1 Tax=Geobacter sp. OR-1 TaxID=1266765 RepID=UPI00054456D3|nr:hypothetical protein [Geobacter sp. OR-1]GAM10353.1 hypothetical protein OR1_02642 [Geobacter sp. OR-1]